MFWVSFGQRVARWRDGCKGDASCNEASEMIAQALSSLLRRQSRARPFVGTIGTSSAAIVSATVVSVISARTLGTAGRGAVAILVTWGGIGHILGNFGTPTAVGFMAARYPAERGSLLRHVLHVAPLQGAASTAIASLAYWCFSRTGRVTGTEALLFAPWAGFASVNVFATAYLQGVGQFVRMNVIRILPAALPMVIVLAAAATGSISVALVSISYSASAGLTMLLSLSVMLSDAKALSSQSKAYPSSRRKEMASYGRRNVLSILSTTLNSRIDQLVLSVAATPSALGLYAVATSYSSVLVPIAGGIGIVGFTTVASAHTADAARKAVRRLVIMTASLALGGSAILIGASSVAIPLVFGPEFVSAVYPSTVLVCGFALVAISYVLEESLRALGRPGLVGLAEAAGAAATLAGVLIVQSYGLTAVAAAALIGYGLTMIVAASGFTNRSMAQRLST